MKKFTFLIIISFIISLLGGCIINPKDKIINDELKITDNQPVSMPLSPTKVTLTFFRPFGKAATGVQSLNELDYYKELEKKTNVHIDFVTPAVGTEKEQYNIMLAGGNTTDLVFLGESWVPDLGRAIIDKAARPLNKIINEYCPNYAKVLNSYQLARKAVMDDNGQIVSFAVVKTVPDMLVDSGFMIRHDWLEKLGLKIPTTIPEWEEVLKAFRDKDPNGNGVKDEIPMASAKDRTVVRLGRPWGVSWSYDFSGGLEYPTITYGPATPEFKDYMTLVNKWFRDGLIDPNYLAADDAIINSKVTRNRIGAMNDSLDRAVATYNDLMLNDPNFLLWPTPSPRLTSTSPNYNFNRKLFTLGATAAGVAISPKCPEDKVKIAAKWLDYGYSEEGRRMANFGIENETYKLIDGEPIFTDLILKNPEYVPTDAWELYVPQTPTVADSAYFCQVLANTPYTRQSILTWREGWFDDTKYWLAPPPTTLYEKERKEYTTVYTDVETEAMTMVNRFIMGTTPISELDNFQKRLKDMGVDKCVQIQQTALDRWVDRGGRITDVKSIWQPIDPSFYKSIPLRNTKGIKYLDKSVNPLY